MRAITQELHVRLKALGETHTRSEGGDLGWWVLLDFGDVVVHVLQPEARDYYGLDQLYQHCPGFDWTAQALPEGLTDAAHERQAELE